jgi:hypothetical protein
MHTPLEDSSFLHILPGEIADTLILSWLPETATMTADEFKAELLRFAEAAGRHHARALLIDVRNFRHKVEDPTLGPWRRDEIVPRYNAAGVRRFGFLLPAGATLPPVEPATPAPGPAYETRHFDNAVEAWNWLATGHGIHVTVTYQVRDDVEIEVVTDQIRRFLAAIAADHPGIAYTSCQALDDP